MRLLLLLLLLPLVALCKRELTSRVLLSTIRPRRRCCRQFADRAAHRRKRSSRATTDAAAIAAVAPPHRLVPLRLHRPPLAVCVDFSRRLAGAGVDEGQPTVRLCFGFESVGARPKKKRERRVRMSC